MSDSNELYQEIILQHSRQPRHFGKKDNCTISIDADNPLCGDRYELFFEFDDDGTIKDACFTGAGCAISKASTSLMLDQVIGKSIDDARDLFERFQHMITHPNKDSGTPPDRSLGKLAALSGVWKFPSRVKCALLGWHGMQEAIQHSGANENH